MRIWNEARVEASETLHATAPNRGSATPFPFLGDSH
jgi:hypothetical protein